jgi:Fe2+ or Zn2+ uptake regulation protein
VTELDDHELTEVLAESARRLGFAVSGATIEAEGLCHDCIGGGVAQAAP